MQNRQSFGFLRVLWTHEKKPKIIAKTYPAGFADFVLPSNRFTFNIDTGQSAKLARTKTMAESICLLITALAAVSREIRGWLKLRKREKDDESHPPFLTTTFRPRGAIIYT